MTTRRGLVALGDSITNGRGEPWRGVPALSWAQWVAEALELPFTKLARDGARAPDVLRDLAPRLAGPYDVACVYVGVNDARSPDWDPAAYEATLRALVAAASRAADRVVLLTLPSDLGRPTCAPKAAEASAIVRRVAGEAGAAAAHPSGGSRAAGAGAADGGSRPAGARALVVPLDDLRGRRLVLPDVVHLTAIGQVEVAARVLRVLADDGLPPRHAVWALADPCTSRRAALRADRRWTSLLARDVMRRAWERRQAGR